MWLRPRRRAEEQAAARQRLGEEQPPQAHRAEHGAVQRAGGLSGDRRVGGRQADDAEQRRERRRGTRDGGGVAQRQRHQNRGGGDEQRDAGRRAREPGDEGEGHERPGQAWEQQHADGGDDPARQGGEGRRGAGPRERRGRERTRRRRGDAALADRGALVRRDVLQERRLQVRPRDGARLVVGAGQRRGQAGAQVAQAPALVGARHHREVDRVAQLDRQVPAQAAERRQPSADAACGRRGAPPAHGVHARQALVDDERQRVEVGLLGDLPPLRLLGRHVGQRADHVARARQGVVADHPRDPEVGELGDPRARVRSFRDDHVGRLDVAVHDAALVRVRERVAQDDADAQHVAVRQGAVVEQVGEGSPADELGDEIDRVAVAPRLVEGDDSRVREPSRGHGLALGARGDRRVVDADALDRHGAVEVLVVGQPDDAEAARPQTAHQAVAIEHELAGAPRVVLRRRMRGPRRRRVPGGLHRLPGSTPPAALLPAGWRKRPAEGKLAGEGRCAPHRHTA